jgi:hypothetical protein
MTYPPFLEMLKILFSTDRLMFELVLWLFSGSSPKYKNPQRILESVRGFIAAFSGISIS